MPGGRHLDALLPGGRHLDAPLPGSRGFSAKSFAENLRPDPRGPVARQQGGWICKIILIIAKVSPATPEIKVRLMIGKLNHFSNCEHQST